MHLSEHILQKIILDLTFSRDLSSVLDIKQHSVEAAAKRALKGKSRPISLTRPEAIKFYKDHGFDEAEIFTTEQPVK